MTHSQSNSWPRVQMAGRRCRPYLYRCVDAISVIYLSVCAPFTPVWVPPPAPRNSHPSPRRNRRAVALLRADELHACAESVKFKNLPRSFFITFRQFEIQINIKHLKTLWTFKIKILFLNCELYLIVITALWHLNYYYCTFRSVVSVL